MLRGARGARRNGPLHWNTSVAASTIPSLNALNALGKQRAFAKAKHLTILASGSTFVEARKSARDRRMSGEWHCACGRAQPSSLPADGVLNRSAVSALRSVSTSASRLQSSRSKVPFFQPIHLRSQSLRTPLCSSVQIEDKYDTRGTDEAEDEDDATAVPLRKWQALTGTRATVDGLPSDSEAWVDYMPLEHVSLSRPLTSPARRRSQHVEDIVRAIEQGDRERTWSAFAAHAFELNSISGRTRRLTACMTASWFDSCFWLVASESAARNVRYDAEQSTRLDHARLEEVANRTRILLEYAGAFHIAPTVLQARRSVHLWTQAWQESILAGRTFDHMVGLPYVLQHAVLLDSELVSRLVCMLAGKKGGEKLVLKLLRLSSKPCKDVRVESWTIDGEQVWPASMTDVQLDESAIAAVMKAAHSSQHNTDATEAAFHVINISAVASKHPAIVTFLAKMVHSDDLWSNLPAALRDEVERAPTSSNAEAVYRSCLPSPMGRRRLTTPEHLRERLAPTIAAALIRKGDMRFVTWLAQQSNAECRKSVVESEELFYLQLEASTELAREANTVLDKHRSLSPGLNILTASIEHYLLCKERSTQRAGQTQRYLIRALHRFSMRVFRQDKRDNERLPSGEHERLLALIRTLTVDILAQEPKARSLHASHPKVFSMLLNAHINVRDYEASMQLFMVYWHARETEADSPLHPSRFLWLFQAALEREESVHVPARLFVHWMRSDLSGIRMPVMPQSLLRIFFRRLVGVSRIQQAFLLEEFLDGGVRLHARKKTISTHGQARRMLALVVNAAGLRMDEALTLAERILALLRLPNPSDARNPSDTALLNHHNIILRHFAHFASDVTTEQRERIFDLFQSTRRFMMNVLASAGEDETKRVKLQARFAHAIAATYISGLQVLQATVAAALDARRTSDIVGSETPAQGRKKAWEMDALLEELQTVWRIDVVRKEAELALRPFTTGRINALLARREFGEAYTMYVTEMQRYECFLRAKEDLQPDPSGVVANTSELVDRLAEPEKMTKVHPLPAMLASRLALALGKSGRFGEARDVLSLYQRNAGPIDEREASERTSATETRLWPPASDTVEPDDGVDSGAKESRLAADGTDKATQISATDLEKVGESSADDVDDAGYNRPITNVRRALIECTSVALLIMDGEMQGALDRIYSLERIGVFGAVPTLSAVGIATAHLKTPVGTAYFPLGPSNVELSELFADTVDCNRAIFRNGDYAAALLLAAKKLLHWTGSSRRIRGRRWQKADEQYPRHLRPSTFNVRASVDGNDELTSDWTAKARRHRIV